MKYNSQGELLWGEQFGSKDIDYVIDLAINNNDEVYVLSADNYNLIEENTQYVIRRYSAQGRLLRTRYLPTSVHAKAMTINSVNQVIVLAEVNAGVWKRNLKLYKYRRGLGFISEKLAYGSASEDIGVDVVTDSNNHVYIAFQTWSANGLNRGSYLLKIHDSTSQEFFVKRIGQPTPASDTTVTALAIDTNDLIYVTAYTTNSLPNFTNAGKEDIIVEKYNRSGVREWYTQLDEDNYGSSDEDYPRGIAVGDAVYVTGSTHGNLLSGSSTSYGGADAFVARLNIATGEIMGVDQ